MFQSIWEAFLFVKYECVHTTINATAYKIKEEEIKENKKSN